MLHILQFRTRIRMIFLIPILTLCLAFSTWGANVYGQATVMTDRADYYPGEIVVITGTGWEAGETVNLVIKHLYYVHPDEFLSTIADADGKIYTDEYYIADWDWGESFELTATGVSSRLTAVAYFTDGNYLKSLTISSQSPDPVVQGYVATYLVTLVSKTENDFSVNLSVTTGLNVSSITFTPSSLSFTEKDQVLTSSLTILTNSNSSTSNFTVKAQVPGTGGASGTDYVTGILNVLTNTSPDLLSIGSKSVNEDSSLSFNATATDGEAPPQVLSFSLAPPASGVFPNGASISSEGAFSWTPTENQGPGEYRVKVVVSDGLAEDEEEFAITVIEVNVAPVLDAIGAKAANEQAPFTFTATASDQDDPAQTLTFTLDAASIAAGMSIDGLTGVFNWTPTEAQGGATYPVTVTVTDNGTNPVNLSDAETFDIVVAEVNVAPVLDAIGAKAANEQAPFTFTATASDQDDPAQTLTFTLDAASIAAGMSIDGLTGVFNWTPTEAQGGATYPVTVTVTDNGANPVNLSDAETFDIVVAEVNVAPVLDAIGAKAANEQAPFTFTATASDQDDPAQTLTFTLDAASIAAGMSIDGLTGVFNWTPTEAQGGATYPVTVTVTDNGANPVNLSDAETFESWWPSERRPRPGCHPANEQAPFTQQPLTNDPAQTLTFTLDAASLGMSIDEQEWTPTEAQGGATYPVTVTVTDNGTNPVNLSDAETFDIVVA
jgi:hypothetical protein